MENRSGGLYHINEIRTTYHQSYWNNFFSTSAFVFVNFNNFTRFFLFFFFPQLTNEREVENKLVVLLEYDKFPFIKVTHELMLNDVSKRPVSWRG